MWDVVPYGSHPTERRAADRRVAQSGAYTGPERRMGTERRKRTPGLLTPGLESGWLCFESGSEKRRLTPIPSGWDALPEDDLERMAEDASRVGRRPAATE